MNIFLKVMNFTIYSNPDKTFFFIIFQKLPVFSFTPSDNRR